MTLVRLGQVAWLRAPSLRHQCQPALVVVVVMLLMPAAEQSQPIAAVGVWPLQLLPLPLLLSS